MIEVGKRYKTLEGDFTCIAIDDKFAYMQYTKGNTAYVWRLDGTAYTLPSQYNLLKQTVFVECDK
jgi:hypothetical protein